ncbi:hypothetical protein GIB67_018850 [Kingdonia uniflora]|uniref:RIN4 pathogenic type III effector avirulence factor Avr cleavage site domain-containing protein n=1 Tax=Kingdonia uniflora TaxID=39325 RepID=A0A7J7NE03_9MAGN|nr:hypothetical protein GIB67_018850 [Kingdonia uniflora]
MITPSPPPPPPLEHKVLGSQSLLEMALRASTAVKRVDWMNLKDLEAHVICFARRKYVRRLRKDGELGKSVTSRNDKSFSDENGEVEKSEFEDECVSGSSGVEANDDLASVKSIVKSSRGDVLQACTVTSGLILVLGSVIRQASHIAFAEGWTTHDFSTEVSCIVSMLFILNATIKKEVDLQVNMALKCTKPVNFEMWHLELIIGLVVLISSCRYLLLQTWPDFAVSSETANKQVLSSLQPFDYMVVAFLPGISEELLFRGALLPLFGTNWRSAIVVAGIFGVLHLGSGRRYPFAVWATFVGFIYGYATILSSSIIVPMASHALNNLVGGILWRYFSTSSSEEKYNLSFICLSHLQQDKGRPLPKFGDWDVNNPASAEGFTVIFNKARDEKKTNTNTGNAVSPRRNNEGFKQPESYQYPTTKRTKWFCCC